MENPPFAKYHYVNCTEPPAAVCHLLLLFYSVETQPKADVHKNNTYTINYIK